MKNTVINLAAALLTLVAMAGCGKPGGKKAYIGTYVSKENPKNILRINKDGTYELEEEFPYVHRQTITGTWKIDEDGIVLYIEQSRTPKIIGRLEGNTLVDQLPGGDTWIRQGTKKKSKEKRTSVNKKITVDSIAGEYTLEFANRGRVQNEHLILKKDGTIAKIELRGNWKVNDNEIGFYKDLEKEERGRILEDRVKIYGGNTFLKKEGAEPIRTLEIVVDSELEAARPPVSSSDEDQQIFGRRHRTPRRIPSGVLEPTTESTQSKELSAPKLRKVTLWSKYTTVEGRLFSLSLNKDGTFLMTDDSEDMKWRIKDGVLEFCEADEVVAARFEGDTIIFESPDKKEKFTLTKLNGTEAAGRMTNKDEAGKKYFGTYISENRRETLEIEPDGTYTLEIRSEHGYLPAQNLWGEWKIDEDGIVLYVERTRFPRIIGQIKGNTLIDRLGGDVFIRDELGPQGQNFPNKEVEPEQKHEEQDESRVLSKQDLIETLEALQQAITKKIFMDVDTTAQCFTSVKEYWRAKRLSELLQPVLRVIQDTLSIVCKITDAATLSRQTGLLFDKSQYASEITSLILMYNGLREAGEKLHYAVDGPTYIDTIKEMLKAADSTTVIRFNAESYKRMLKACLESDMTDIDTPLIIARTSKLASDPKPARGAFFLRQTVREEFRLLIDHIKDNNLPQDFPVGDIIGEIKQLKRQIGESGVKNTEARYTIYQKEGWAHQSRALGAIAELNKAFSTVSHALGERTKVEIYAECAKLTSTGTDVVYILTYKILGVGEAAKVTQQATLIPQIVIQGEKTFNVDPEEEFYQIPQQMLFSLAIEFSNVWKIVDDTVLSLLQVMEKERYTKVEQNEKQESSQLSETIKEIKKKATKQVIDAVFDKLFRK